MQYIIQTFGQRDVQYFYEEEFKGKKSHYAGFDKDSLKEIQKYLSDNFDYLQWKAIEGNEGKQKLQLTEIKNGSKTICFPFTEHILAYLQERQVPEYKFILLYTDRQKSSLKERYIQNEPWLFPTLLQRFWDQLTRYYKLEAELEIINICDSMKKSWDIDTEFSFKAMDKITQSLKQQIGSEKILLFNDGGVPNLTKALEVTLPAYFSKQISFMDQNYGNIESNKQYRIQKSFSLKFAMQQNIKHFQFTELYKNAMELQLKQKDIALWNLITLCKQWLFEDSGATKKTIKKCLMNEENKHLQPVLRAMEKMLKQENAVGCNFIRTMQEARKENWWSMVTMLISVAEILIQEYIKDILPNALKVHYGREYFVINQIPFSFIESIPEEKRKYALNHYDSNLAMTNWFVYEFLINAGLHTEFKDIFLALKQFIDPIIKIKETRNKFIHQGVTITKEIVNKALVFDTSMRQDKENLNSRTFKNIIDILTEIKHLDFINWLPILQDEIEARLSNYSPI